MKTYKITFNFDSHDPISCKAELEFYDVDSVKTYINNTEKWLVLGKLSINMDNVLYFSVLELTD